MNDPEAFVSRWSRRKREALRNAAAPEAPPAAVNTPAGNDRTTDDAAPRPVPPLTGPAFDPATLPPIESITAETDIRVFLTPGVPSELTQAALRRTWTADPKIRNFVGLADYDWDFNATDAISGFGPLAIIEEIGNAAARIVDAASVSATPIPERLAGQADFAAEADGGAKPSRDQPMKEAGAVQFDEIPHQADDVVAMPEQAEPLPKAVVKRRHGGALPK